MNKEIRTVKVQVRKEDWDIYVGLCKMAGMSVQESLGNMIYNQVVDYRRILGAAKGAN